MNTFKSKAAIARADKAAELLQQISQLEASAVELQSTKAVLAAELESMAPAGFILDTTGKNGDSETDAKLDRLAKLNTRLDLLPAVRDRIKRELAGVDRELSMDLELAQADARRIARERVESLREKFATELLPLCGNDTRRSELAVEAIVQQTEAFHWYQAWKESTLVDGNSMGQKLLTVLAHIKRFQSGENIRAN